MDELTLSDEPSKSNSNRKTNNRNTSDRKSSAPVPPPKKNPPKKKPKQGRMTVSREDSMLYAGSLVGFSVVCGLLRRSVVVQTIVSGTFWGYLYWLTSQMERYIAKSSS